MTKELKNALIAGAVILVVSVGFGSLGVGTLSVTSTAFGLGAATWFILQNLSGNRTVTNVPDAERNRLLAEPPPPGQALVYIYREGFMGRAVGWEVVLNHTLVAQLKSPRFTRVVVTPGEHVIVANPPGFAGAQSKAGTAAFTIAAGETMVFALKMRMGMVQGATEILREPDVRTAVARLAVITMVAPESAPAPPAPLGTAAAAAPLGSARRGKLLSEGLSSAMATSESPTPLADRGNNVLGQPLTTCGCDPMTGFYRTGCCETGPSDLGVHTVCCIVSQAFLESSRALGNDLLTPMPQYGFPGLRPGDRWCVCAARWLQAQQAGAACPVVLEATHENTLKIVPFEVLIQYAVIPDQLH